MSMIGPSIRCSTLPIPTGDTIREDYPVAFWSFVFFTFVVFVAPHDIVPALRPLYLGKTSAIIAIGVNMFQRLSRNVSILPKGREFRLLAIFVFLGVLSIPFSFWPGGSLQILVDPFLKSLAVCMLTAQVLTSLERFKQMVWCVLLFGFTITIMALVGYKTGTNLIEGYRMSGVSAISGNPNDFALTISLIIPFGVMFFLMSQSILKKALAGAFLLFGILGILLTYSRSGFVMLAVLTVLTILKGAGGAKRIGLVFLLVLMGLVFAVLAPEGYVNRIQSIFEPEMDRYGSSTSRWNAAIDTFEVIAKYPFVGVGMGMNILALNEMGLFWLHVHNIYLQIASELGIPALIVFLILISSLIKVLREIQRRFRGSVQHYELVVLATASEISLLCFCVGAMFYPVAYYFYFYYIAGFALALKGIAAKESEGPNPMQRPLLAWQRGEIFRCAG